MHMCMCMYMHMPRACACACACCALCACMRGRVRSTAASLFPFCLNECAHKYLGTVHTLCTCTASYTRGVYGFTGIAVFCVDLWKCGVYHARLCVVCRVRFRASSHPTPKTNQNDHCAADARVWGLRAGRRRARAYLCTPTDKNAPPVCSITAAASRRASVVVAGVAPMGPHSNRKDFTQTKPHKLDALKTPKKTYILIMMGGGSRIVAR